MTLGAVVNPRLVATLVAPAAELEGVRGFIVVQVLVSEVESRIRPRSSNPSSSKTDDDADRGDSHYRDCNSEPPCTPLHTARHLWVTAVE